MAEGTTTTTKGLNKLKTITWLVASICLLVVISHNFFPAKDSQLLKLRAEYNSIADQKDDLFEQLNNSYLKNDKKEVERILPLYLDQQELAYQKYKTVSKRKKELKFFGFNNKNVFFFETGVFFALFFISIFFRYVTFQLEYTSLKKTYTAIAFIFTFLSFYYLIWSFYNKSDLPYYAHLIAVVVLSIMMSFATQAMIKWFYNKGAILAMHKENFRNLWRFIINDVPNKHIKEEQLNEYIDDYIKEIESFKLPNFEKS